MRIVGEEGFGFRDVCIRHGHVAGLVGFLFDDCFFTKRTLDSGDEVAERGGLAFAEIEDVAELAFVVEAGGHALDDVVYVSVVAARGAVAELLDAAAFVDGFCERMDREVGTLARAIDGEKAEVDRAQAE